MNKEVIAYLLSLHPAALRLWSALYATSGDDDSLVVNIGDLRLKHQLSKASFYTCFDLEKMVDLGYINFFRINKTAVRVIFLDHFKTETRPKLDPNSIENQINTKLNRPKIDRKQTENPEGENFDNQSALIVRGLQGEETGQRPKKDQQNAVIQLNTEESRPKKDPNSPEGMLTLLPEPSKLDLQNAKVRKDAYERAKTWLTHPLRKRLIAIYLKFHGQWQAGAQMLIGNHQASPPKYNLDGADLTGLTLLAYKLHKELGFDSEDTIAQAFDLILSRWEDLPDNIRNFRKPAQINHNLTNIFAAITKPRNSSKQEQRSNEYNKRFAENQRRSYSHLVRNPTQDAGD